MLLAAARQKSCKSCKLLLARNRVSPAKRKFYKIYKISLAAGEQAFLSLAMVRVEIAKM